MDDDRELRGPGVGFHDVDAAGGEDGVSARNEILDRIRKSLDAAADVGEEVAVREYRRAGGSSRSETLALLVERLEDYGVIVRKVSRANLPGAIQQELELRRVQVVALPPDFPRELVPGERTYLSGQSLCLAQIESVDGVVTGCALAIAETGTIVMNGGPRQGKRALSLLPDHHLCIIEANQVVEVVPEAIAALRSSIEAGMPVTFISGPSATSDIELIRVEGVHGPRTLDVLLVEDV